MSLPGKLDDLKGRGYRFDNHARCKDCHEEIEWWSTPNGKKVALNLMDKPSSPVTVHWNTCDARNRSLFGGWR